MTFKMHSDLTSDLDHDLRGDVKVKNVFLKMYHYFKYKKN